MSLHIDTSHSEIGFSVRHMMLAKVHGRFRSWTATLEAPAPDLTRARFSVSIDASSIDTQEDTRDAHLRSADFFDVERHPRLTYQSRRVEKVSSTEYRVIGDLTLRGVTREVPLQVELLGQGKDPWGNQRLAFSARGKVRRSEFGLTWNQALELGGVLVSEEVALEIEAQVVQKADVAAAAASASA